MILNLKECKKTFDGDYSKMSNETLLGVINKITPLHEVTKKDMNELLDIEEYLVERYIEAITLLNERN